MLPRFDSYETVFGHGVGLRLLQDSRAESVLVDAHNKRPRGHADPALELAMFFLDQSRFEDALTVLSPPNIGELELDSPFVHLVRGVALERLGDLETAGDEYERYAPYVTFKPVPRELLIDGSEPQRILLPVAGASHITEPDAISKLARIVQGEAGIESIGGKRAVAWTVRTRVWKGSVGCAENNCGSQCCLHVHNGGDTIPDKYWSVMTQEGEFAFDPDYTDESFYAAFNTYFGKVPDPHSNACIAGGGIYDGGRCTGFCAFQPEKRGAFWTGARAFYSTTGNCGPQHDLECLDVIGKTCGNGGSDHCFSIKTCNNCCATCDCSYD